MRKLKFALIVFLSFVSVCFASMTIYLKDGTSREVHKITFNGNSAELYLIDGNIIHVPVETLDLPSSGIGAPVGTYGTSAVTGQRSVTGRSAVLGDPGKQARLKEQWDESERTAVAISAMGPIKKGDTVKIVGETSANTSPDSDDYYDKTEYVYDPQTRTYRFIQKNLDHAFIVVYKNPDGTFGKRLIDAASFQSIFKTEKVQQLPKPMPEYPVIPDRAEPGPSITPAPPSIKQDPVETKTEPQTSEQQDSSSELQTTRVEGKRKTWIGFSIFLAVLVLIGFGAWFLIQRSQRPYIDPSKFKHYEDDLREFEIAIWLRNGKTADQLMEICLKKFYQDHPPVLAICHKMLKGSQKGLMLPFIIGQTGKSSAEAALIYDQIYGQMERIRRLIQEVSQKTGNVPVTPVPPVAKPPAAPALPVTSRAEPSEAVEVAPPVVADPVKQSSPRLIEPDTPMRSGSDLPSYASSVLNQITFLSNKDEK